MCGFIYKAGSDHSLKGKHVFSADGSNIGTVVSSFGNILIIEEKFKEEIGASQEIRKYEIPLIEIKGRGTINYSLIKKRIQTRYLS
jgi:sporulation protein YlmC with PRC-barrel domain